MKTLENGLTIFNATPHPITFWEEGWEDVVTVDVDEVISAKAEETVQGKAHGITFVNTVFVGNDAGKQTIKKFDSLCEGPYVIVGSIIAAQAYPGDVVAMVPAPGYERVPPDQKRMRPDRFTIF